MASEADIEALLREGEDVLDSIQKFAEQGIPNSLSEAAETGIDLVLKAGEASILIRYDPEERREDRKRVIRLDQALALMSDFENEYLRKTISGRIGLLWDFFASPFAALWNAILAIWTAIKTLRVEAVRAALAKVWIVLLKHLFDVVAVAELVGPLKDILAMRRKYDTLLRSKALKQRTVKRVWRRKRTRA